MKIIVIGGGAAGFFAAIECARKFSNSQVTLLEAGREPLAKVKISGGGRCNVSHHCFDNAQLVQYYPRGSKALRGAFSRFNPQDTVSWFAQEGVKLKTEADGRMFPISDSSQSIVNALLMAAQSSNVTVRTQAPVIKVTSGFEVHLKNQEKLTCDRLLIATGGSPCGHQWARDLGHQVVSPVPSLFTFNIRDDRLKDLLGIAAQSVLLTIQDGPKLRISSTGPLLITHWGISGPAVLKLSAWAARVLHQNAYKLNLVINWLPEYQERDLKDELVKIKNSNAKKQVASYCPFNLPKRLWQRLVEAAEIPLQKIWAELSKTQLTSLELQLRAGSFRIEGKGVFKDEFVTCGGVDLSEINFKTIESKICPGLYFAGEVLDIDGVTGGFNFQSAWTTGWIAGQSMGE